jgi:hypothetical protein
MTASLTRRGFLAAAGLAGAAIAVPLGTPAAVAGTGRFLNPGKGARPGFRWWWPDGLVDPAEIRAEIDQIAAAGFGRMEIAGVHHSITDASVLDTAHHGWGTPAWRAGVQAALEQAVRREVTVDITLGPAWPASVPTIAPDSPAAVKELAWGAATVAAGATYDAALPATTYAAASGVTRQTLLAVHAFRTDPANDARKITGLNAVSLVDLTAAATGGRLTWTAPADGTYILLAYWVRGSGQQPEGGPHTTPASYAVDHFSAAGTQAIIDYWESAILTKDIKRLLRQSGGALFEDSIELETKANLWTPDLLAEFRARIGYDLLPLLPAVLKNNGNLVYAFEAARTAQIPRDLSAVFGALINEHHFSALKAWAHSLGLDLRAQPYGLETDAISSAAILDIPEGESIGFKNLDDFRCLAGARDMAGRELLSEELGAYLGGAYNTTWNKILKTVGGQFAAGVNNVVLHGFAYASAPGAAWPGFAAFTPLKGTIGYGEAWGPRQPTWRHVSDISGYFSRIQYVLRQGRPSVDVAYFWQSGYVGTGLGAQWFTAAGVPLGWTHQMLSPALLDLPLARVAGGRLNPQGPAYKVLVVDGDIMSGREHTMPVAAARKLLALARAGLPIVFVGSWTDAHVPGVPQGDDAATLTALVTELLALPSVRTAADTTGIPAALAAAGIEPDAVYAQSSTLLNAHRVDGGTDYYYFCNGKHAETVKPAVTVIDHQVALRRTDRKAVPHTLDAWSGELMPIALYTEDGDRTSVRITLQPGESTIVVLARPSRTALHATATTADQVVYDGGALAARAATAGTYTATRSDGRTVSAVIGPVPAVSALTSWRLEVEDRQPSGTTNHSLTLDALAPWPSIAELQDVSGLGRYTTTIELAESCRAYLDLGEVLDTYRITVNGHRLPADQINRVVDLRDRLRRGVNTIEIEVATTLNNRLRVSDPGVYGAAARQNYGLIGPVRLIPYGQAPLR